MGRVFTFLVAGLLSGCLGYTIGPVQPTYMKGIHRLAVPIFGNNTVEPDVDALATTTLIKQLQQDGTYEITSADRADAVVRGTIISVQRAAARSVVGNVLAASEFSLLVKVHFEVVNAQTGAVVGARDVFGSSSFFVQNDIQTQEHQAIPLAIEDAATQMASYLSKAGDLVLYLVASPIGNLGDITFRALEVLRQVDLIAAEDTRRSSILLARYEIRKPLISLHEHNEARRTAELVQKLETGSTVALLTDAGTPTISDPGYRLVLACRQADIPVTIIPGASAVLTALAGSALPSHKFYFGGFLPVKSGQRQRELEHALRRDCTSIYFESPHRLLKSLEILKQSAPDRLICVAREMTKQFEEYRRGPAEVVFEHFEKNTPRGEITLLISGE